MELCSVCCSPQRVHIIPRGVVPFIAQRLSFVLLVGVVGTSHPISKRLPRTCRSACGLFAVQGRTIDLPRNAAALFGCEQTCAASKRLPFQGKVDFFSFFGVGIALIEGDMVFFWPSNPLSYFGPLKSGVVRGIRPAVPVRMAASYRTSKNLKGVSRMGPGGADTLSADPKELATEAGNAQDCAAKSQRMRTENTAGSIPGKISGGKAASTVKTTSEHLSNELKDIEHQLSDYSDDLVATMRTIEQTDQDEAGMYRGMIPPGDAGGLAEGIGAGAGAGAADGGAAGGSGAAIGGGHSYGSAGGASGGSAGGGHSYGSANGGAGQLFGSPGASGMSSLLDGAGGGSVVGGHSYGSTESGQIVGSHGGHNSTGALGGIHSLMSGDSDSFSSHAGGSHPAPMPRVEGSGDPAPMPHAETAGNAAPMPHVESQDGKILPSVEQGHSYGSQLSGSGSSHGGSLGPAPMPQVETPGDPAPCRMQEVRGIRFPCPHRKARATPSSRPTEASIRRQTPPVRSPRRRCRTRRLPATPSRCPTSKHREIRPQCRESSLPTRRSSPAGEGRTTARGFPASAPTAALLLRLPCRTSRIRATPFRFPARRVRTLRLPCPACTAPAVRRRPRPREARITQS